MTDETVKLNYRCPKCGHTEYDAKMVYASGGFWTRVFDIQNRKMSAVVCERCRYVELYMADTTQLGNIFDFFAT